MDNFAKAIKKRKIPEHLLCPLRFDFMDEPMILFSEFTYEKSDI